VLLSARAAAAAPLELLGRGHPVTRPRVRPGECLDLERARPDGQFLVAGLAHETVLELDAASEGDGALGERQGVGEVALVLLEAPHAKERDDRE
jgi:hypothetical protein